MKRGFGKGFVSGILVAALTAGLGVSALAATRTITVDDNIRVTLNGAVFSPKNEQGKEGPLFSYNGTTYAPVRAICEAAGMKVEYDSAPYTAVLTTQDQYIASTPTASGYITVDKAKQAALTHAGVNASDATFVKAGLDWDDGKVKYEVEFYVGNTEYDYDIDATSGAVLSYDREWDDISHSRPTTGTTTGSTTKPSTTTGSTTTSGQISADKAKEIALSHAGVSASSATFVKAQLDRDDGRLQYDVEFYVGTTEYDYEIDANTGAILSYDRDFENHSTGSTNAGSTSNLITAARAKEIALAKAPSGVTVVNAQLDGDDGRFVYELEILAGRTEYDFEINASTGSIIKWDVDYDD